MAKAAKKTVKTKTVKAKSDVKETNLVRRVSIKAANKSIQAFDSGDTVNVYVKVKEGEKERVQLYKGIVTKIQGAGAAKSFTVRKISAGVGVERTFPFNSPALDKVELVNVGKVRRSKLYFLRKLSGKAAKIESELVTQSATAAE
ncbi:MULTISPECIES: 50S ribosomal protein L19 [unclassified Bdellovibrio]|jgi:large subunit ribosomal protein L19|uniref:50S ribosomal protein L19 n=1 Tax=unclassified Bdellovibrio TaxID=2633795 RepID=UPI00115AF148|nr:MULTISPECIES: 50S ribosomal protein L19 [unclassified Bdellovibrio]QDK45430.1 50S ribosomal protein L19 [Bdellovibrio sp. ZAP7]QLY27135.1 50S ribosomal protein L19 [Bdellovibrio sp. KM01]